MPAITTNDLKTGITLELDNGLFQVVEFQHVKPGKGGAFVRTRLRNVRTGNVFDRTFNAGVRVEQAIINREEMQLLYRDGDDYVFMNNDTYEQMHVAPVALGERKGEALARTRARTVEGRDERGFVRGIRARRIGSGRRGPRRGGARRNAGRHS